MVGVLQQPPVAPPSLALNVRAYGATGDGVTNDRPAIQAAIDACKDTSRVPTDGGGFTVAGIVEIPPGLYVLNAPLHLFSGQTLRGGGPASRLVAGAGFSGTALVLLDSDGTYFTLGRVEDLGFDGATAAVANAPSIIVTSSHFQRFSLNTKYGLLLTYYAQMCVIADLFSYGPLDMLLHLKGNFNSIRNLDKEGDTGTSTEPYILLDAHGFGASAVSMGNRFEHIVLEGATSSNKTLMTLDGTGNTTLDNLWFEPSGGTDGYALRIINSDVETHLRGILNGISPALKVQVHNTPHVTIDVFTIDATDTEWNKCLDVDSVSAVTIKFLYSRYGGAPSLASSWGNVRILESYARVAFTTPSPVLPMTVPIRATVVNVLSNPSFESSGTGWTITGSPTTAEYIASEIGPGLMAHYAWGAAQSVVTLTQPVTILAAWVGKPMLLSALVKMTPGTGYVHAYLSGAGLSTLTEYGFMYGALGWGIVQQTFVPQSAGTLTAGIRAVGVTDLAVDGVTLTFGAEGLGHVR